MERKRIYLSSPTMHGEEQAFVQSAFDTNWVAPLGPNVDAFEKEMADYIGGGYAAALSAGTAAIHLAVILAGVKEGDVVFAQSLTFAASVNPACYEKAKPVFIDSEPDTWNMDPVALEKAFEKYPHPAAVIAVHLYGTPSKIDRIRDICKKHQVPLIEDAAEALGSSFQGQKLGTFGDYGILSFNGNKIITSSGGGMLLCSDEAKIKRARFLATQARDPARYYQHSTIGYNYRMSNVVAGIGRGQLLHLEEHKARKNEIYRGICGYRSDHDESDESDESRRRRKQLVVLHDDRTGLQRDARSGDGCPGRVQYRDAPHLETNAFTACFCRLRFHSG